MAGVAKNMKRIGTQIPTVFTGILERRPLLFFVVLGIILILFGIVFGIRVVNYLKENEILLTGTALISALLLGSGILSIFTGVILRVLLRGNGSS
jgi:H+/Cl- antiporter ClcA